MNQKWRTISWGTRCSAVGVWGMVGSAELREAGERGGPRTRRVVHTKECQWFERRCGRHFKNAGCPSRPAGPLGCAPRPATAFDTRPPPPTTAFGIALPDRPRQTKQYGLGVQSWSRLATLTGLCWFCETTCRLPVFTVTDSRHPGSQGIAHFIPPSTFHTLIVSTASPYTVLFLWTPLLLAFIKTSRTSARHVKTPARLPKLRRVISSATTCTVNYTRNAQ